MNNDPHYIELRTTEKSESVEKSIEGDGVYIETIFKTHSNHVDFSTNIFDGNYVALETRFIGSWDWTEEELCMVCKLPLKHTGIVQCPYCGTKAHKKHLREWLKIRKACPFCRRELSERTVLNVGLENNRKKK